jgi:demethylmenaquinone methyltransferase/2-methoxy-6-polyprenyl-1,4-benzoquinol methylase
LETTKPYKYEPSGKKEQIQQMFNAIAPKYDFLNHLLSFGIDKLWRRKAINRLKKHKPLYILDVATGTGDFALEALRISPIKIIGIDISEEMLEIGKQKILKAKKNNQIELIKADSENMPFADNSFDAVIVAFGVRNFENLERGLSEIYRVLRPKGRLVVLEFSKPTIFPFKQFYWVYFNYILPLFGKIISKENFAYTYLPKSVENFADKKDFTKILSHVGYLSPAYISLTFGTLCLYEAEK